MATSVGMARVDIRRQIQFGSFRWIIDADIKGFFDNINHDWMIRMLEERINDKSFLKLIRKWLKAGILEEDGAVINPVTGTPQGGAISAVLANIYLHYALDLWFEKRVKPNCRGAVTILRFADDFICCFQYHGDAKRCLNNLKPRLQKFNLTLSEDKTRLIKFTRFITNDSEAFVFLGFEYRWKTSRNGKLFVGLKTSKKKYKLAVQSVKSWIKTNRSSRIRELIKTYKSKLQGHWNYYGVCGNFDMMWKFYWTANRVIFKWINRRSQRKSYNWDGFNELIKFYKIPRPKIIAH